MCVRVCVYYIRFLKCAYLSVHVLNFLDARINGFEPAYKMTFRFLAITLTAMSEDHLVIKCIVLYIYNIYLHTKHPHV